MTMEPKRVESFHSELSKLVLDEEGGVLIRWLVIGEVMGTDGEKALHVLRGPTTQATPPYDLAGWCMTVAGNPAMFRER